MISSISIEQSEKWDNVVKSFKKYDVYYLSGYTKAFQSHGDGEPCLFFYKDKYIRAINVVMKKDIEKSIFFSGQIPKNTFFDISTPYGYGGFLVEGQTTNNSLKKLDNQYVSFCKTKGIITEFARFHPILDNYKKLILLYDITELGKTITINLDSPEQIWNELTSKNRNVIRKAYKSGVRIYWGRDIDLLKTFMPLYNATMDKDNAKTYYYFDNNFYKSILNDIKYNFLIFYAVFEEKIIAMSIILFANQQIHYHLSASDKKYQHLAPTNLMLYEVALWGSVNGFKTFHLGGGVGCKEDNLYKFKKAFNRNTNTSYFVGRKVFDKDKYNKLIDIRKKDLNFDVKISFFPAYRG